MSRIKKILLTVLILFIAIQFIQPARNKNGQVLPTDISKICAIPQNVESILRTACYDCHSNNTNYPWYVNIQPVGWMLARHIKEGKGELNFSEFGSYSGRRQASKLKSIENSIKDGAMPLSSYTLIHKGARLSQDEKELVMDWARKTRDSLAPKN
ncbi:MAG TPA: heme-binding domain-containing protein [Puia sp.]|uniref:heme-binding domain-containing protein n=1 Tax=Puia sp. TaxID=2045100 RepID=UPI00092AB0DB|nr:heme-binding domain-containing protein [Puia sp.]MBN8852738.1 heme-binding domain-containing protein [Sphingobacteriales bacterium]OJW55558.1 MAG: cytochrome C [Sphingobacteriales bacterium 50-39]HVU96862.1 heme-binding domain-containing protein [Puia sp.]